MSNLQFEIDEDDITNYFKGLKVNNFLNCYKYNYVVQKSN